MSEPHTLLQNWRKAKEIGPLTAATAVGVRRETWWRWETGKSMVAPDHLDRVEAVTGISRRKLRPDLVELVRAR